MLRALINWVHGMNDVLCRQLVPLGRLCRSRIAAVERSTFSEEVRSSSTMYGTVYSTAAEEGVVGRIDDGIDGESGDVTAVEREEVGEGVDGRGERGGRGRGDGRGAVERGECGDCG